MALSISVEEGHALEVLDLLCRGRALRISPQVPISRLRPELVELAARRIGASVMRVLVEGGHHRRTVLRDGRRVEGRIWDRELLKECSLRFTGASYGLWIELTQRISDLARSAQVEDGIGASRPARRKIRRIVKIAETGSGDWLFYALAVRHLRGASMPPEIREDIERRLAMGSPLALLIALVDVAAPGVLSAEEQIELLLLPENVRLLECSQHLLVDAWVRRVELIPLAPTVAARIEDVQGIARVLRVYVNALDAARRLDLAQPIIDLLLRLTAEGGLWSKPTEVIISSLGGVRSFSSLGQREVLRRAYADVVEIGAHLLEARDRLAGETYGDPRYEEGQLVLERCEPLRARVPTLMALTGALTNRLG